LIKIHKLLICKYLCWLFSFQEIWLLPRSSGHITPECQVKGIGITTQSLLVIFTYKELGISANCGMKDGDLKYKVNI
jgi:hypothetical protein